MVDASFGQIRDIVLASVSALPGADRRVIATVVYVAARLGGIKVDVYDIYPSGVESETINSVIDFLIESGSVVSRGGRLFPNVPNGSGAPDSASHSPLGSILRRILQMVRQGKYRAVIDMAGYLWLRDNGISPDMPRTRELIRIITHP